MQGFFGVTGVADYSAEAFSEVLVELESVLVEELELASEELELEASDELEL